MHITYSPFWERSSIHAQCAPKKNNSRPAFRMSAMRKRLYEWIGNGLLHTNDRNLCPPKSLYVRECQNMLKLSTH